MNLHKNGLWTKDKFAKIKKILKQQFVTIQHIEETDEYRVNIKANPEETAYYTDDLNDAFATGIVMVNPPVYNHSCKACHKPGTNGNQTSLIRTHDIYAHGEYYHVNCLDALLVNQ